MLSKGYGKNHSTTRAVTKDDRIEVLEIDLRDLLNTKKILMSSLADCLAEICKVRSEIKKGKEWQLNTTST